MSNVAELLCFESITRVFPLRGGREVRALDGVSFSIEQGQIVTIIGPSGCGKSTLLRIAAGLDFPTSGRALYRDRPIAGPGRERGMVMQAYNAFPWLTVRQNVAFGLPDHHDQSQAIGHWLQLTGLEEFADSYPKALSGGMLQRLALARTLIVEPTLLLLDEPFGSLDEPVRRSMQLMLLRFVRDLGCAVLLVTHDITEALFLGDKVILLSARPGRVLETFKVDCKERSEQLYASAEFRELHECVLQRFPHNSHKSE